MEIMQHRINNIKSNVVDNELPLNVLINVHSKMQIEKSALINKKNSMELII